MTRELSLVFLIAFISGAAHARSSGSASPALIRPGGLPLYFSTQGPFSYSGLTRRQLPKDAEPMGEVRGRSCQYSLTIPLSASLRASSISGAVGDGTYAKILREIGRGHPGLRGIYDAKVDLHQTTILGVFGRLCTEIAAEGFR